MYEMFSSNMEYLFHNPQYIFLFPIPGKIVIESDIIIIKHPIIFTIYIHQILLYFFFLNYPFLIIVSASIFTIKRISNSLLQDPYHNRELFKYGWLNGFIIN